METIHRVEGIVLTAFPFREGDHIITLLTPSGILKIFIKSRKNRQNALAFPLTEGEYLYVQARSDLLRFHEGTILSQNIKIRDRLETLLTAEKMIQALLSSQWPGKPTPHLYQLFRLFLQKLPTLQSPTWMAPIFFLKILKHEGMLQMQPRCTTCGDAAVMRRYGAERFCAKHAPLLAQEFSPDEEKMLYILTESRSFEKMLSIPLEEPFIEKVEILFNQAF